MMKKTIIGLVCVAFFGSLAVRGAGGYFGERNEYTVLFRVGDDYTPIHATISVRSWELDKNFSEISDSSPDFLVFARRVVSAILSGDIDKLKKYLFHDEIDKDKLEKELESARRIYRPYKLEDIKIKAVLFVEDAFYFFCLASSGEKTQIFTYSIRKKSDGYGLDIYNQVDCVQILYPTLKQRFLDEGRFVGVKHPKFTNQTVLTSDLNHENFVAVNYNAISFAEGVPLYNETGHDLLKFLFRYWDCKLHGSFNDLAVFHDKKSMETIRNEIERSGMAAEAYTRDMQRILKDEPYASMRLTMAIIADPITIVYETGGSNRERGRVLYNKGEGYRFIRYHSFGPVRDIFDDIIREGK